MKRNLYCKAALGILVGLLTTPVIAADAATLPAPEVLVPQLDGEWFQIAPNAPDVTPYGTGKENACDFTIFQSDDGKWHNIACIRGTSHHGQRVLHHWTSDTLTATNWKAVGLFDQVERGAVGKPPQPVSVQAPHHVRHDGKHYLFYNSYFAYCLISNDGVTWTQHKDVEGKTQFFRMGRDVCVFRDPQKNRWIAYYTGSYKDAAGNRLAAMVARTAPSPEGPWSTEEHPVRTDGNPESPFVIHHDGRYYLWQQMSVYVSDDPLDFNHAPLITHMTGQWFDGKYAPEVIRDGEDWYVAGYSRGIHLAKMQWVKKSTAELDDWRAKWKAYLDDQAQQRQAREAAKTP